MALCAGSKDATFSEMCVICGGIRDASPRRSVDFCFRPEPTRVLFQYRPIDKTKTDKGSDLSYGKEEKNFD